MRLNSLKVSFARLGRRADNKKGGSSDQKREPPPCFGGAPARP